MYKRKPIKPIKFQDESVKKRVAPVYIGIFETSFVLGPAIGFVLILLKICSF